MCLSYRFCQSNRSDAQNNNAAKIQGGYYRTHPGAMVVTESMYETRAVRGSGPGGQGCQSSSNKIELRLKLDELRNILDEETFESLLVNEDGCITSDQKELVVSSHEHRSGAQNKQACLDRVEVMLKRASWVAPMVTSAPAVQVSNRLVTQTKQRRWKESLMRKARQQIRSGKY